MYMVVGYIAVRFVSSSEDNVRSKVGQCLDVEENRGRHQGPRDGCTF